MLVGVYQFTAMKILIVEDEPLIAQRLVRLIQDYFSTRLKLLEHVDEVDRLCSICKQPRSIYCCWI